MKKVILILCIVSLWQQTQACTTFTFSNKTGHRVFGRNYDFPVGYGHIQLNYRDMCKTAIIRSPEKPLSWTSEYGSISFNQVGREFPYGGMNEAGLVIEQMWLQETNYPELDERFGLSELQWIQYQLDCSASVQEVIDSDSLLRISQISYAPLHFLVSDASGDVATIEYLDGKMTVHRNASLPHSVLANCTYDHSLEYKQSIDLKEDKQYNEWTQNSSGRFVKAVSMIEAYSGKEELVDYSFGILEEIAQGDFTQWSIVYDITKGTIHYKSNENPAIQKIELSKLDFSCQEIHLYIDLAADISGGDGFQKLTLDENFNLIETVVAGVEFLRNSIPEGANLASAKYAQSVHCLKNNLTNSKKKTMNEQERIVGLLAPVEKYLKLVLPEDPSPIKEVWLTHGGYFKSSQKAGWVKIKGKQHFLTDTPEFEWTGKTPLFKATDSFVEGKGQLKVKLLGFIPLVNVKGPEVDQAELLRWLGESVWFPTNLIPGNHLSWSPINSASAKLNYSYKGQNIWYIVHFNEKGYIVRLETERYMEKGKLEKWVGKLSEYKEFHGMVIPTHVEAFWKLEEGDFQYVDFNVQSIEYKY